MLISRHFVNAIKNRQKKNKNKKLKQQRITFKTELSHFNIEVQTRGKLIVYRITFFWHYRDLGLTSPHPVNKIEFLCSLLDFKRATAKFETDVFLPGVINITSNCVIALQCKINYEGSRAYIEWMLSTNALYSLRINARFNVNIVV